MSTSSSEVGDAQAEEQQQPWDDWNSDEGSVFTSLFESRTFNSLDAVLLYDSTQHAFDLRYFRAVHGLDQYDSIRLLNFIRGEVAAGRDPRPTLRSIADGSARPWAHDSYLQPVLVDDDLLFHDWEAEDAETTGAAEQGEAGGAAPAAAQLELAALREENASLRAALLAMRSMVMADGGLQELAAEAEAARQGASGAAQAAADSADPSNNASRPPQQQQQRSAEADGIDQSYFDSYSAFGIHQEMLADRVRTEAYRQALEQNSALIKGARVLDVGCGTGILSMFAARGGAASVVGVDGSDFIASYARSNALANGLSADKGGPVTIVASQVEQLQALPSDQGQEQQQVDVLVSEWMGYALFFESMLDSVLLARDRFLKPGGAVLPDLARLHVGPAGAGATGIPFWNNVYGFAMPTIAADLQQNALREVVVRTVSAGDMLGEGMEVRSFDLATMAAAEQDFTADFRLTVARGPVACHALVLWFDTSFSQRFCCEQPVELSTSPFGPPTHWGQAVLHLPQPVSMAPSAAAAASADAAVALEGQISMARSKHKHRSLDIALSYRAVGPDGKSSTSTHHIYAMKVNAEPEQQGGQQPGMQQAAPAAAEEEEGWTEVRAEVGS